MNKKAQVGVSIIGLVLFFVSFIVLTALMPTIIQQIETTNAIENMTSATKVVLSLIPLMLGVAMLVGALTTQETGR